MEADRRLRVLDRTKGKTIIVDGIGFPSKKDGRDGDAQLRATNDGVALCYKYNGAWHYVVLTEIKQ